MSAPELKMTFYGGVEGVTGVNILLEANDGPGTRILIDCGLFQGEKIGDEKNHAPFPYDPASIDFLMVSHAHIDHTGRIPKLVKDGFRGKIFSTPPTKEIARVLLIDSIGILSKESKAAGTPPIYTEEDVERSMELWQGVPYRQEFSVGEMKVCFRDAGHVLGSAMTEIKFGSKKFVFTGDLGNSPAPFLPDTEALLDVDYLVMESVYGDRDHENRGDRKAMLEDVIEETMNKKGTLLIPAFSFERTQEVLFEIKEMVNHSRIPLVPVFLDSPLAIAVTEIYKKYLSYYKESAKKSSVVGDDLFSFPQLRFTRATEASRAIHNIKQPKIIIAGSGMSNGGRIVHHEKEFLPDPKNTLLILGYQSPGTLGRKLQDGAKHVRIFGEDVEVRAKVVTIGGYSAHKDSSHLLEFVDVASDNIRKVFVALGEPKAALFLTQRIRDYLGIDASVPKINETISLPMV